MRGGITWSNRPTQLKRIYTPITHKMAVQWSEPKPRWRGLPWMRERARRRPTHARAQTRIHASVHVYTSTQLYKHTQVDTRPHAHVIWDPLRAYTHAPYSDLTSISLFAGRAMLFRYTPHGKLCALNWRRVGAHGTLGVNDVPQPAAYNQGMAPCAFAGDT